jgi:hypothetical protein
MGVKEVLAGVIENPTAVLESLDPSPLMATTTSRTFSTGWIESPEMSSMLNADMEPEDVSAR